MLTQEIRRAFLRYFSDKGHTLIPSSPVVPYEDPTLLFINAGMNQFKDVFLGSSTRDYACAASSQKCIRAGGKHNDLENVGHTPRHLTFFEMLGNFSFGAYFKEEAIQYAWEVSTEVFGFAPERLFPTVFRDDDEAFAIWSRYVPAERITRFGEKQNFWAMGDSGPCGPCSELLFDRGAEFGEAASPAEDLKEERYLEFWNLVFMQSNRDEKGLLSSLPNPCIDTGAGLERLVMLKMGAKSVYETDVLGRLIEEVAEIAKVPYRKEEELAAAFRVIADHLRTLAFAIADGAQPSNIERGYVLRKVLRRAVRYGRMLGLARPFLAELVPPLIEMMGADYPELEGAKERVIDLLTLEEEKFLRTLKRGGNLLGQVVSQAKQEKREITGEEAFKLKDTYGLPLEEVLLLAKDANLSVDTERYQALEQEARERSRQGQRRVGQMHGETLFGEYLEAKGPCRFVGYRDLTAEAHVTALVVEGELVSEMKEGEKGMVLLNITPFYAEMGGQVGDTGALKKEGVRFQVSDCQSPCSGVVAHIGALKRGKLAVGDRLTAAVDGERRAKIARNHTATHILHWALQEVLGEHVKQAGSVVDASRLRFDFSHHKSLSREQIVTIERLVNRKIRENLAVEIYELSYEEAQSRREIKQFFGEKYGSRVRVVDIEFSKELCGGTHTSALGTIGYFRIAKEGSVAAGVRRIEAVTGEEAELLAYKSEELVESVAGLVKCDANKLLPAVDHLLAEKRALKETVAALEVERSGRLIEELLLKKRGEKIPFISEEVALPAKELRSCAEQLLERMERGVVALGGLSEGRCHLFIAVSQDCIAKGVRADQLVKELAPLIGGGGGGRPQQAQAGGQRVEGLKEALLKVSQLIVG